MAFSTRVTELLGIRYPIIQAGMSWASSNAELALAVSQAGALGVIAAGPMYPDALRAAIRTVKERTDKPFAVNVPLYNPRAASFLDIVLEEQVPILVASQGGPKQHLARFKDRGVIWLHVTASPDHAAKAAAAGVDAVIAVGTEAGGHPPPSEVGTLVVVRAVVKAVSVPVIAGGGVADGAGIAAMLCLGAEGVQLGTRFLMTPESNLHQAYKDRALAAGIDDTTLVGRGKLPIRVLKNEFTRRVRGGRARRRAGGGAGDAQRQPNAEDGGLRWRRRSRQGRGRAKRRVDRRAAARGRDRAAAGGRVRERRRTRCPAFAIESR